MFHCSRHSLLTALSQQCQLHGSQRNESSCYRWLLFLIPACCCVRKLGGWRSNSLSLVGVRSLATVYSHSPVATHAPVIPPAVPTPNTRSTPSSTSALPSFDEPPRPVGMDITHLDEFEQAEPHEPQHDTNTLVSRHSAQSSQLNDDETAPIEIQPGQETAHLTFTDVPLSAVLAGKAKYGSAVHSVNDTDRISAAMALMKLFGIGAVLVRSTSPPNDIVGIVSSRDYIDRVSEGAHPTDAPVTHFMTDSPIFAYSDDASIPALELMTKHSFRHLPVKRRCCGGKGGGEVIGMVSIGDLVRVMLRQYRESNGYLKDFIDGKYH